MDEYEDWEEFKLEFLEGDLVDEHWKGDNE